MHALKIFLCFIAVLLSWACSPGKKSPLIGVSQCSDDIWRNKLNEELLLASHFYGAGIPVILFDRKIDSDKYTAYMGADNVEVGRVMGTYIAEHLEGKGRVAEILGLEGSSPANERHQGFVEALKNYPGIHLVAFEYGGWLQEGGYNAMSEWLTKGLEIDAVFGQNDRMAHGAWEAAAKKRSGISYFGVDALAGPGGGLDDVLNGVLTATYLYPTHGDRVMELAMTILRGGRFSRENSLESALVDKQNAGILQMQEKELARQRKNVELVNKRLDESLSALNTQRLIMWLVIALATISILGGALALWSYFHSRKLNLELEERNRELQKLQQRLEENTEAKLSFFTAVSHEFRTPLTLISGPIKQVLKENIPDWQRKHLETADRNSAILLRLVGSILDFRKVESGMMQIYLTRFDLALAIKEWLGSLSEAAEEKKVNVHLPQSLEIEADMHMLERILYNLVSNSLKHTGVNGQITVTLEKNGAEALLTVADDGEGIPKSKLPRIFEEFYQGGTGAGTGIGLALVRSFVKLHGGSVTASSEEGFGTTISVYLPLSHPGAEIHESTDAASYTEQFEFTPAAIASADTEESLARMTEADDLLPLVLFADDNEDIRSFVTTLLSDANYRVILAKNGQEALDKALRKLPDLIISDIMMPVMDGLELCRNIKKETATSHIPVILLTAKSLDEQRAEGYDSGADAYISKPFNEKVLLSRIANLLRNRSTIKKHFLETGASISDSEKENSFLLSFRKLVRSHLSDPELSVEWIGGELGLSRVQLFRKIKSLTGYSPVEVIRITRLNESRKLLRTTDKTVAEIAYLVGFSSPSYFSKNYRELFGILPTDER